MTTHRVRALWIAVAAMVAMIGAAFLDRRSAQSDTGRQDSSALAAPKHAAIGADTITAPVTTLRSGNESTAMIESQGGSVQEKAASLLASPPAIASLNKLRSAREVIEFARRTDDPAVQEYAIWSVTRVCRALRFATAEVKRFQAFGASKPERTERVLKQLMAEYQSSADSARERCTDFEGSDDLQKQLAAEVERNRLPLSTANAAIGELSRGRIPADVAINEARNQLDKVLAGNDATAMMSVLSFPIARTMRTRMQAEFPQTAAEDWPLGPLVAAYHLAACRMQQLDCGAGSIERDVVCAQYGECRAPDVETSYRRLFLLYGIPFADTDRLANKLSAAMLARDTAVLLR